MVDEESTQLLFEGNGDGINSPSMDHLLNKALEELQECKKRVDGMIKAIPGVSTCGSGGENEPRVFAAQEQASRKVREFTRGWTPPKFIPYITHCDPLQYAKCSTTPTVIPFNAH